MRGADVDAQPQQPADIDRLTDIVRTTTIAHTRRHVGVAVGAFAGSQTVTFNTGKATDAGDTPTSDTMFQIGSVTKLFTALALADQVVNRSLSLDTALEAVLPGLPLTDRSRRITLRHLASHTSGLPRLPKGLRRQALHNRTDPYRNFSTGDLLAALTAARPHPEPGSRIRYSNFGMALLGHILTRHTGLEYEQLIADRITGPLRMPDTTITMRTEQERRTAISHSRPGHPVPDWHLGAMPGAGALRSTVQDLLMFLRAHLDPSSTAMPEALRLVQQPQAQANRWLQVGLGWHLSPLRGTDHRALWHNGGTAGSCSYVALVPDAGVGVVALTNTGRPVDSLGVRLLTRLVQRTTR
jgi:D-alanyl-D-alanine-carboxypeptidase/D-alanyl-D-alanine-endopeptidase